MENKQADVVEGSELHSSHGTLKKNRVLDIGKEKVRA